MKKCSLMLILALIFSCSSDSDQPEPDSNPDPNPSPPVQEEEDTTPPTINITGLQDLIEVLTTLEVTVSDESDNVNTTILINGDEVFTTTQKSFSYELDPFDFPSGETTVTIRSTDDSDNQGTESETFELKKLLFRSIDLAGDDPSNDFIDLYIAINSEETGELITSRLMQSLEDATFYAPEDFTREKIVVTKYYLGKGTFFTLNNATSFASLEAGIEIMTVPEAVETLNLNRGPLSRSESFGLSIMDVPVNTDVSANSRDYFFSGSDTSGQVLYNEQTTENVLLYSIPSFTVADLDSYKYLILTEFENTSISLNDFNSLPQENRAINNLPPETESYSLLVHGYLNMERYSTDNDHQLYDVVGGTNFLNTNTTTYSFPIIPDYEVTRQRLTINFTDGREVRASFRGLLEPEIPDFSVGQAGDQLTVSGSYDSHGLIQDIEGPVPQGFFEPLIFRRFYIDDDSNSISVPFDTLEIPLEVIENLNAKGFSLSATNNVDSSLSIALTRREQEINYQDRIFYFIQRNEAGDEYSITFPLN